MEEPWDMWHEAYGPLDFSKVHGFPSECYDPEIHDILPEFHGNDGVSATHHIASFCKLMADVNVHHEDEIMIVFAITLVNNAMTWFCGLLDKSIDSVPKFFERFLLRWHDGTVDEIEQLAKIYDALIPRVHHELEEEIHEEQTMENLVDEAIQEPFVEDITEEIPDMAEIEDVKLPQVHTRFHDEELELPQVPEQLHAKVWTCLKFIVLKVMMLFLQISLNSLTMNINQWIESSCAWFDSSWYNFFLPNNLMEQFSFIHEQIARHS